MSKYTTFRELLTRAMMEDVLPDIRFTDNTIQLLGTSVEHLTISNQNAVEFSKTAKNLDTAVREYEYLTENMAEHYNDLKPIKDIADAFAKTLNAGIKSLSNTKKVVTKLTEATNELANKRMIEDPVLAVSLSHIEEPSVKFGKVDWDKLNDIDEEFVYNNYNNLVSIKPPETPSKLKVSILIDRLPFGTSHNQVDIKAININKQAAKATLTNVCKRIGTKLPIKDVKYVLAMLFDLDKYKCTTAVNTIRELLDDPTKINSVLQMARDFTLVLDAVNDSTLAFSASTKKDLLDRKEILKKYADMSIYMATYYRTVVWKDSVVVPGNKLNPDTWADFRKKGGSSIAVAHHLRHFYSDSAVPAAGITANSILSNKDKVIAESKEAMATNMSAVSAKKKDILRASFIYTATDWLNKNKKFWSKQFIGANNVSEFVSSIYDSTVEASIESAFYKVILNSCCNNTLVTNLYNRLSDIYKKHTVIGGKLTEAQCEALDLTVYADMITEFLLEQKMIEV